MTARILAYHRICDDVAPQLSDWSVSPAVFRRQIWLLRKLGYRGVSVRALLDALDGGDTSQRLIAITFDDGYLDTITAALPVMEEAHFTATAYIVPDHIGGVSQWEHAAGRAPLAGWDDLSSLVEAGWEIGLHSRSHPPRFDRLAGDELDAELTGGRCEVEARLATQVDTFAYPHGRYSAVALRLLAAAGYRAAVTTEPGAVSISSDRRRLPRYEIKRRDTLVEFAMIFLAGFRLRRRATFIGRMPRRFRGAETHTHPAPPADAPSPSGSAHRKDAQRPDAASQ